MESIEILNEVIESLRKAINEMEEKLLPLLQEAHRLDLYTDKEFKVCGEAHIMTRNQALIRRIEFLGTKLLGYQDEFRRLETELDDMVVNNEN